MGLPNASVCVTHHGVGSLSAFVQPFQVWPSKKNGKLHSNPDTVAQVEEIGAGGGRPEIKQNLKQYGEQSRYYLVVIHVYQLIKTWCSNPVDTPSSGGDCIVRNEVKFNLIRPAGDVGWQGAWAAPPLHQGCPITIPDWQVVIYCNRKHLSDCRVVITGIIGITWLSGSQHRENRNYRCWKL